MTGPFVQSDFSPGPDAPPLIQVEAALRTSAGTAVTAHALLTNTADETRVLSVTAHGVDAKWLPRPARSQPLGPGESIGVELAFRPIEGTVAAAYPLAIAVQSLDPTSEAALGPTAIANVTLTVDAPGAIAIHLSPTESTGVFRRSVQVQIENFGVTPASVELETEASAGIRVGLSSHRVDVPAGQKVPVRAHVRPRRRRLVGSRIRYRFNVTGRAGSAPQTAEGSFVSRAMLGSNGIIAALVSLAMVFWIGAVVMLIPKLASSMKHQNTTSANAAATQTMTAPATQPGGAGATSAPSAPATGATGGGSGGSTGSAPGGGTGPSSGGGSNGGSGNAAPASANSLLLSGIVSANAPGGVKVQIAPVSPIDAANSAQTATTTAGYSVTPLGFSATALNDTGKITSDAMNVAAPTSVAQNKTTTTTSDGGWQIAGVAKPGYYLITFSKSGYQTARVIVDSSSAVAAQPINVTLSPGQGTLTGTVRGPNGPVGGATVTITDGVNTVSTSTTSVATAAAAIGSWSMTGLATPSSYLVSATATGLSTESTLVDLTAGGQATVQLTLKSGVTSLQGKIQSRDNSGNLAGLGGATVTATDARGNAQSATAVTKGSVAGNYILPDLAP
ncbi:MAG: carboxypeptidase-like regulatory domain-containing protein, partial [Actinomycetia bacterium]|nr:carboxypeptidase-like regulatory domain-containing protein [Actinomycetes bacterium]